jgi:hypothetical protein
VIALDRDVLADVTGGEVSSDSVVTPYRTRTTSVSDYRTCEQAIERSAGEKYPDSRWFFQRWVGARDSNAAPRADWFARTLPQACGLPPQS